MRPGKVLLVGLLFGLSLVTVLAQDSSESYELDEYEEDAEYDDYDYIEEGEDEEESPLEREARKKLVKGACQNKSPLTSSQLKIFKPYTKDFKTNS